MQGWKIHNFATETNVRYSELLETYSTVCNKNAIYPVFEDLKQDHPKHSISNVPRQHMRIEPTFFHAQTAETRICITSHNTHIRTRTRHEISMTQPGRTELFFEQTVLIDLAELDVLTP